MIKKEASCCFTGHRKIEKKHIPALADQLYQEILNLFHSGVTHFFAGGALGFDTIAARTVLALKQQYPSIHLHLILPCKEQDKYWNPQEHLLYQNILWNSDSVEYVSDSYTPGCMQERNRKLVDSCSHCICYHTEEKGGTAYTVNYARKKGLTIINLADDATQISLFEN